MNLPTLQGIMISASTILDHDKRKGCFQVKSLFQDQCNFEGYRHRCRDSEQITEFETSWRKCHSSLLSPNDVYKAKPRTTPKAADCILLPRRNSMGRTFYTAIVQKFPQTWPPRPPRLWVDWLRGEGHMTSALEGMGPKY